MEENKLLLGTIEDKYDRFLDYYTVVTSDFMNVNQQTLVRSFVKSHEHDGAFFYGGFEGAERRLVIFIPDYMNVTSEEELFKYFNENAQECPLSVLDVKAKQGGPKLSHRDYLGALMGEGIKREKIGDILVSDEGAQIIMTTEMAEYLKFNYTQAGRVSLTTKILPINELNGLKSVMKEMKFTVSSPRLDNMISSVFGISRKSAVEAINQGIVYVDNVEMNKPDYSVKGGATLVLRGKGKAHYNGTCGTSKKGKVYVSFNKFV